MRKLIVLALWSIGIKGQPCKCSFYEASHYNSDLEFDIEDWPCAHYQPANQQATNDKE
jgi:hypothetical protein